jgi:hypothetical protein
MVKEAIMHDSSFRVFSPLPMTLLFYVRG